MLIIFTINNNCTTEVQAALCHPGPDLVVCDEGHIIRNDSTQISKALKKYYHQVWQCQGVGHKALLTILSLISSGDV